MYGKHLGGRRGRTTSTDEGTRATDERSISRREALKAVGAGAGMLAVGTSAVTGQTTQDGYRVPANSEGPRCLYLNDFGGEGDNQQGLIHFLQYVDYLRVEGICSTQPLGSTSEINSQIDMYAEHYENYVTHSDYPTPDELRSLVYSGASSTQSGSTPSGVSETAQRIIDRANADSEDPLYVCVGGSMTEVAQALHEDPSITDSIRVHSVGSWNTEQDPNARDYVYNEHPDLWWVESDDAYVGTWTSTNVDTCEYMENNVHGVGAFGDYWETITPCCNDTGCWQTGDFFTYALLLHGDPSDPTGASWGGSWQPTDHGSDYWTDGSASSVGRFADEYFADFARRLEWGVTEGIQDDQPPTTPGNLSASDETQTTVDLSWGASTDNGEAGLDHYVVSVDGSSHTEVPAGTTSTTVSGLAPGTSYEVSVTAVDGVGNTSDPASTTVTTTGGSVVTAINAGGDSYASGGITYEADPLTEGDTNSTGDAIEGTSDDTLYQTERYGESLTYDLSVPNGSYTVQLQFAEIYWNSTGERSFDVAVEGTQQISGLDLYAEVGHDTALVETIEGVTVSDGSLTIEFTASADNAKVSAIRVLDSDDGGDGDETAPTTPSNVSVDGTTASSVDLSWDGSTDDGGSGIDAYNVYVDDSLDHTVSADSTGTTVTGLSAETQYTLGVSAVDSAGNESDQATVTATTQTSSDTEAPTAPSNLSTDETTASSVDISWDGSTDDGGSGLDTYNVYVDGSRDQSVAADTTSATVSGLSADTEYAIGVSAVDGAGNESDQATVSVTTDADGGGSDPIATIDPSTTSASTGDLVQFRVTEETGSDTWITDLQWDLGNGSTGSGWYTDERYQSAGTYTVTLTATDNEGNTSTDEVTVTIS
ncbi:fibronectin type III domain-containing protein [Halosimplex sp. J119]